MEPHPCDFIFILGGSHPGLWESGVEVYFKGYGKDIIVTGGYTPDALCHPTWKDRITPESEVIRRELIQMGVPASRIFSEKRSTNTYENVRFGLEIYDFDGVSSVLAVCKSYAAGRQIRTLRAQLDPDVKVIPYPFDMLLGGDGPFITRENWMDDPGSQADIFANLLKIVQYGRAGHLVPVDSLSDELNKIVANYFEKLGLKNR